MKLFVATFCLLSISFSALADNSKAPTSVVIEGPKEIAILSKAQCFYPSGKTYKLSDMLFGYIATGSLVKKMVLSNRRMGGPENSQMVVDIDLTLAADQLNILNQTFQECVTGE